MHQKSSTNSAAISSRARRYGGAPASSSSSVLTISAAAANNFPSIGLGRYADPAGLASSRIVGPIHNHKFEWGMANLGKKQQQQKGGWRESKAHLHALYIILCVVILNMVVLLGLLHFKLLLIVPFQSPASPSSNSTKFEARKFARMKQRELMGIENSKNTMESINNDLAVNLAKIVRPFQGIERKMNGKSGGEESRISREKPVENIGPEKEENFVELPLKKVELHLKNEPMEGQNATNIQRNCPNCPQFPSIPADLQPIRPILTFYRKKSANSASSNQFLVDCQKEEDAQGQEKCTEWAKAGFCESHPATKWLFCRKHCLCSAL